MKWRYYKCGEFYQYIFRKKGTVWWFYNPLLPMRDWYRLPENYVNNMHFIKITEEQAFLEML